MVIVELLGAETHVICESESGARIIVRQGAGAAKPKLGESVRIAVSGVHTQVPAPPVGALHVICAPAHAPQLIEAQAPVATVLPQLLPIGHAVGHALVH